MKPSWTITNKSWLMRLRAWGTYEHLLSREYENYEHFLPVLMTST